MTEKGLSVLLKTIQIYPIDSLKVFIGIDKNVINDYSDQIMKLCNEHGIDAQNYIPGKSKIPDSIDGYIIAISWKWIIHNKHAKLIVLHDSLLPAYRGFNPLVSMLINKEPVIGVTAIHGSDNYDLGEIIYQETREIDYPITILSATKLIVEMYKCLIEKICDDIKNDNELPCLPQDETKASYSLWRDELDYNIDWSKDAEEIQRTVDATGYPYLGAITKTSNGHLVRINECIVIPDVVIKNRISGKIIFWDKNGPTVVCGKGLLKILEYSVLDKSGEVSPHKLNFRTRFILE